ncbi:MAG: hypothetical protein COB53_08385 [Elusimicrobia bacterium]|nr:MAG: hypothetical protein COB53_08385 [Elusimicrobiota bacterium]
MKFSFSNLRYQILIPFSALLIMLAGVMVWRIWSEQLRFLEAEIESKGDAVARALAKGTHSLILLGDADALEEKLKEVLEFEADVTAAVIYGVDGKVLALSVPNHVAGLFANRPKFKNYTDDFRDYQLRYRTVLDYLDEPLGIVGILIDKKRLATVTHNTVKNLAISTMAILALVGFVFTFFISRIRMLGETLESRVEDRTRELTENQKELSLARDAAMRSSELKSQFLANMSHEIRTPINGVIGINALLLERELDEKTRELANTVDRSAQALLGVINDILDFSKIEAGKLEFDLLEFKFKEVLSGVLDLLSMEAYRKNVELICRIDRRIPSLLMGDSGRVRQVLLNIASNAVKFSKGESVDIQVSMPDQPQSGIVRLKFEIRDTGVGIPKKFQERLFSAFDQADGSITREFGGTGLGLAISKSLAEKMGGELSFRENEPKGSIFEFQLNLGNVELRPMEPSHFESIYQRILLVDDHAGALEWAETVFRESIQVVLSAKSGGKAVKMAMEQEEGGEPFDLILIDMHLGEEQGRFVKASLREGLEAFVPIGAMCFIAEASVCIDKHGFDFTLNKPVKREEVESLLRSKIVVSLPKKPIEKKEITPHKPVEEGAAQTENDSEEVHLRVLLVEDNETNQIVTQGQLNFPGVHVEMVSSGKEALELLKSYNPHIILMDCQLPVLDGYETSRRIRKSGLNARDAVIVALTAHAMKEERIKCIKAGMDDHLSKPITKAILRDKVKEWTLDLDMDRIKELNSYDEDGSMSRSLMEGLLGSLPFLIEKMKKQIEKKDWDALEEETHSLRGTAKNLGCCRIGSLAASIELRLQHKLTGEIGNFCDRFQSLEGQLRLRWEKYKQNGG